MHYVTVSYDHPLDAMRIRFELMNDGIAVEAGGTAHRIVYPEDVWRHFEAKTEFAVELVFLHTYGAPFASDDPEVVYDHPEPRFRDRYDEWFRLTLPYLIDRNPSVASRLAPEAVARVTRKFRGERRPADAIRFPQTNDRTAVLALTLGKDSLASLLIAKELGLDLSAVYCHPSSASDDPGVRALHLRELGSHLSIPVHVMRERVEATTSGLLGSTHSTGMMWSMSVAAYVLMMLPFVHHYRAGLLGVGNEFGLNYPIRVAHLPQTVEMSPLQTTAGTARLDAWIRALTGGASGVTSLVQSLHTIGCHKLVHLVRRDIGLHQVSCRKSRGGANPRWCQECGTCAENYLFIRSMGRDPASLGFTRTLFDEASSTHFNIVRNGLDDRDPFRFHAARQELLAFDMALRDDDGSWMARFVRERYGDFIGSHREALRREYLQPVDRETPLPLSAEAVAIARRLLADCNG